MQSINFYYNSVKREESQFIIRFFDMCGVYVHENYTDIDQKDISRMKDDIVKYEKIAQIKLDSIDEEIKKQEYDINLYLTSSASIVDENYDIRKIFVIDDAEITDDLIKRKNMVIYQKNSTMLNEIIDLIYDKGIISLDDKESFSVLADIYVKYNVLGLLLKNDFPVYEPKIVVDEVVIIYKELVTNLRRLCFSKLSESNQILMKYVIIRMACEGNKYAQDNKRALLYTGLDKMVQKMIDNDYIKSNYEQPLYFLVDKIQLSERKGKMNFDSDKTTPYNDKIFLEYALWLYRFFYNNRTKKTGTFKYEEKRIIKFFLRSLKISYVNLKGWYKVIDMFTDFDEITRNNPEINFKNVETLLKNVMDMNMIFPMEIIIFANTLTKKRKTLEQYGTYAVNLKECYLGIKKLYTALENIDDNQLLKLLCVTNHSCELENLKEQIRKYCQLYSNVIEVAGHYRGEGAKRIEDDLITIAKQLTYKKELKNKNQK